MVIYAARLADDPPLTSRYTVVSPIVDGPFDYWQGLADLWRLPTVLVNVEHDMQFSDALVYDLLACPHPRCSHAYQCHIPRTFWAHSYDGGGMDGQWINEGDEWAAYSAIGFCKIEPEARALDLGRAQWQGLERAVNEALPGPWHIHWPGIDHRHLRDA